MRAKDWRSTGLGPPESWPQSLRTAVSLLLNSRYPMFLFWGPQLIKIYNDGYRPITGDKHPWALGRPGPEVWPEIWADIGPMVERVIRKGEATWSDDLPLFMRRRGFPEEVFFTFSYSPVRDESGGVGGMFCACTETTAKVQGERRLKLLRDLAAAGGEARSVADACALGMQVLAGSPVDVPFALLYLEEKDGARLAARAGVAPEDLPGAWPLGEKALLDDLPTRFARVPAGPWPEPPSCALILPIAGGAVVLGVSSRIRFDDSYRSFFELVAGQLDASLAAARASEADRRRAEALAELDRAKTAFFSNVSHEFRTPLTLLLGPVADALADAEHPLSPPQRERQELVLRNALRLQKLVNTLLDFSRIEAGRAQASYLPTDLAGFTANLASSFRSAVEKAGLQLNVHCPPLSEPAYIDREMWEKIVLNLLSNAFKFTFEGEIALSLRDEPGEFVLDVRDTGTGIPAAELPHVFERFRRVEGARSRTHEGTGIGLALVQELARLHGGAVAVQSIEGRGSTFTVRVPRGRAHLPPERIGGEATLASTALGPGAYVQEALGWLSAPQTNPEPPAERARPRVVWADDNADMRDYVARLLAPRYNVETVSDGEAALAAARRHRPDLVLADVMMPGLDGLGLVQALRADDELCHVPVVLLSARAGEEARIEGLGAGADEYVQKPFSARELLARVEALLQSAELRSRIRLERADLGRLFAQTPVPIAVLRGPELVFEMANPAYVEAVGGRSVVGKSFFEALPEVRGQAFDERLREVMRSGTPHIGREVLLKLHRRGALEDAWFTYIYAPLRGADGAADRVIAIVNEVTEQVGARKRLEEADRRKDEFLAMLSHELRNPLAPLANALEIVRLNGGAAEPPVLAMMERQLKQLVRLTDDLLDMSRITRGSFELRRERCALRAAVRSAVETADPAIRAAHHTLEVSAEEDLWVDGDAVRLAQIIANLLNNAARYTEPGGRIGVSMRRDGAQALVSVRDNGAGLEAEEMARLFAMFARGKSSTGLGIGLALARRLAEMHGGALEAASDGLGKGAVFTLRLPLAATGAPAGPRAEQACAAMTSRRVLLVDDNRDAADSLGTLLARLGADVRVAHDGSEALAAFESYRPGVVILDIGMPGMDGYQVARAIRGRPDGERIPLVAVTGWGQEQDRRRVREAGFDHHLVKPADIGALRALLGSL